MSHPELDSLTLAHVDCDAFYASVEKCRDPTLAERPVIVGGGKRGVVTTCCYIARLYGVRSAMPMFKALQACPDAVIIKPDMARYRAVGQAVKQLMHEATPLVQSESIDEAYLDLSARQGGGSAAGCLAALSLRVERELGITISIGLSYNKFLAKLASDLDKPRGFRVVGRADAQAFLSPLSVRAISGVGPALGDRLAADGFRTIGDLRNVGKESLAGRYGRLGERLWQFARGEDHRPLETRRIAKSISAETTFNADVADPEELARRLRPLCEKVASQLQQKGRSAAQVTLKLKDSQFCVSSRGRTLPRPTQMADVLFETGSALLAAQPVRPYRLIGIGASTLSEAIVADPPDLFAAAVARREERTAKAIEEVRRIAGSLAIRKGRDPAVRKS